MTPPPRPPDLNMKTSGKLRASANQSMVTISSSVQAGEAIQEKPMQAIAPEIVGLKFLSLNGILIEFRYC